MVFEVAKVTTYALSAQLLFRGCAPQVPLATSVFPWLSPTAKIKNLRDVDHHKTRTATHFEIMRACAFFLLILFASSVFANDPPTDPPICETAKGTLDSADVLMKHCVDYCKDTSAVATSYGAPNVAVERKLVDSDLCQDGENGGNDIDCAVDYIDLIQNLFVVLETKTKVFSNVRAEQKKMNDAAALVGIEYQPQFTLLMQASSSLTKDELAEKSKTLSTGFNNAFEKNTEASRGDLQQSIKTLSDAIRNKQQELVDLQKNLENQLKNCTGMSNGKAVKEVCRQRQGSSESNYCCCRTNGLGIYKPKAEVKVNVAGKSQTAKLSKVY